MSKRRYKGKYYSPKRRAIYAKGEDINHLEIFDRDGWICFVCNKKIDRHRRFPDLMAATLEHIVALKDGGTHTADNTTCSHAACNFARNGSLPKHFKDTMEI